MFHTTEDIRIQWTKVVLPPVFLEEERPITEAASSTIFDARNEITAILNGSDDRLLVLAGPCSIHDAAAAREYAALLQSAIAAFSADLRVADASAFSPSTGNVVVTIYSTDKAGVASADLISAVATALNADDVRPLTDVVEVQAATIQHYTVSATVTLYPGPDATAVRTAITNALAAYTQNVQRLGYGVTLAGMYGALDQAGVQNATIQSPATDVAGDPYKINVCDSVTVNVAPLRSE